MTKVLVEVDYGLNRLKEVCDRCGTTNGEHSGKSECLKKGFEGQKFAKFQEKESKMKYDKETVVGVIKQAIECTSPKTENYWTLIGVLEFAKAGKYSTPTLEEVWKEKLMELSSMQETPSFVFEFDGLFYKSDYLQSSRRWSNPLEITKL